MAGLGAGICEATLVVTPAETLKVKLIHDRFQEKPKFRGLFHGVSTIIKQSGFGGVYKGLLPTIIKQGSNQGVRFLVYEDSKKFTMKAFPFLPVVVNSLISGGIAGAASVFGIFYISLKSVLFGYFIYVFKKIPKEIIHIFIYFKLIHQWM